MILLDTHVWVWWVYAMGPAAKLDKLAALLCGTSRSAVLQPVWCLSA